eukprot:Skav218505  [mRNA]  locus=scaffold1564:7454:12902:+ [translate_table: standard]
MAAIATSPREAAEKRHGGVAKVLGEQDRGSRRRRGAVDAVQDDGVREPSHPLPASSVLHGDPQLQGTGHVGDRNRSSAIRQSSRVGGLAHAKDAGVGSIPQRAKLEHSSSSGVNPGGRSVPHHGDGPTTGSQAGAVKPEAQRADEEQKRRRSEIGTRRRGDLSMGQPRDATLEAKSHSRRDPKTGDLRERSRGDKRDREGQRQTERRRSPREGAKTSVGPRMVEVEEADERERKRQRQGEEEERAAKKPYPDEGAAEMSTAQSSDLGEETAEAFGVLQEWLRSEETGGLSAAQCGALLALTAYRSGTSLGHYLSRVVSGSSGERIKRQRSLLPLPLMEDSVKELKELFDSGEFRKLAGPAGSGKKQKAAKEKAGRATRRSGLLIWHGLVVTLINIMWTGGGRAGRVHQGPVSRAQEEAQQRLWQAVKTFLDDTSESKEKVPRSLAVGEWGARLGDVRISYHGEVIEKGQSLTLDQILPGLPPAGYGGSVQLAELCEGELRRKLEDPMSNMLEEDELPEEIPAPRVHCSPEQWELIGKELVDRGLAEPVEDPVVMRGKVLTNGAFGVVKPNKFLPDDRPVLRLIMDFRGVNSVTKILEGDVRTLTGAPSLQHVVLPGGKVLRLSADDLVAAFYLFALPRGWSRMMTFGPKIPWRKLGIDRDGDVHIGARVLPMGWSSAVGVLQHAHRRLALRNPLSGGAGLLGRCEIRRDSVFPDQEVEDSLWSLYLDDMSLLEVMDEKVAKELSGKPPEEQKRLRNAYSHWGIPFNMEKAKERAAKVEKLGGVIDGDAGLLKSSTKRALDSISLGFWLLRQKKVPRKALQVFMGKEVHTIQFRRPLFAVFDYLWKEISEGETMVELQAKSIEEVLLAGFSQPLRFTDLRSRLHEVVTASDASESGGGMVYGSKLTRQGLRDSLAVEEAFDDEPTGDLEDDPQKILVIDCFAGIGGLSRALELAEVKVERLLVIESDRQCRHLQKVRWPGCDIWTDIQKVRKQDLEKVMRSVPGLTGVICGGGSPCQGISQLSSERQHLDDPRSNLFFKLAEVQDWVEELCAELQVWNLSFVENVVPDKKDLAEMSRRLRIRPVKACSSGISRVRRPRLFWSNIKLLDHESFTRWNHDDYDEVVFDEKLEPLELVPDSGWRWKGAEKDETLRLPTFTRAIPRKKPPPHPAGLSQCSESTLELWRKDDMKFPPYTYQGQFLFQDQKLPGRVRVASATERERLMGFRTGYTEALFKKEAGSPQEEKQREIDRQAALGNSFHAPTVACLIDVWLWSTGVRMDPLGSNHILHKWHEAMAGPPMGPLTENMEESAGEEEAGQDELSDACSELGESRVNWLRLSQDPRLGWRDPKLLSIRLIHQFLRRTEFRGSDVRLDLQVAYKPDAVVRTTINPHRWVWKVAQSYPWLQSEHINVLELRAILRSLEWRARTCTFHSARFMHLSDSQICISVLTKGRSSSRRINRLLRKIHSLCLALNAYPLSIKYQATKAERKLEREKIGRLDEQKVSPLTLGRYEQSLQELATFLRTPRASLLEQPDLEQVLNDYIQHLWEEGDTKTFASYAVAAVQFHKPALKGHLKGPWRLLSLWGKLEQPVRATPLDPEMLFAFCGVLLEWQWPELAYLSVIGFCGLLRTGEIFHLRRKHVVLPQRQSQSAVIFLQDTKTTQRNQLLWEKVILQEQVAVAALRRLCANKAPDDFLTSTSVVKFRELWKLVVSHLGLSSLHYIPYSLRRGGATSNYRQGTTLDQLLEKGRWKHLQTARLYLDQGLQEYASLSIPASTLPKIRAAQRRFKAAGLGRVE